MTQIDDLMYSILALDSYNRGYSPGVSLSGDKIGKYTVEARQDFQVDDAKYQEWISSNFYASVYHEEGSNAYVISYRGTDDPPSLSGFFGTDGQTGWPIGGGWLAAQAKLAIEFYNSVRKAHPDATIVLTGHSLGGGLAGFVAKLTNAEAYIYDNMPFELAADNALKIAKRSDFDLEILAAVTGGDDPALAAAAYQELWNERQLVRHTFFRDIIPETLASPVIHAWQLPGEILAQLRAYGPQSTPVHDAGISGEDANLEAVPGGGHTDLHWIDTLIAKLYSDGPEGDKSASAAWESSLLKEWFSAYYSNGLAATTGFGSDFKQMQKAISYSALDTNLLFGDTAMKSMFGDLVPLGVVAGEGILDRIAAGQYEDSAKADTFKEALVRALVQYSAQLAHQKVESQSDGHAADGILRFSGGGGLLASMNALDEGLYSNPFRL